MVARRSPQTERVIGLINLLTVDTTGEGVTLSELARRLQLSKATCYPMLEALTDAGFITRHPTRKTFHLGPALIAAGQAASRRSVLLESAREAMVQLGNELNLTCWLYGPDGGLVRVLDQAWHSRRVTPYMRVGEQYPFKPPTGAAIVAFSDDATVSAWLARGAVDRADQDSYRERLVEVRRQGYSTELEDLPLELVRPLAAELGSSLTPEARQRVVAVLHEHLTSRAQGLLVDPAPDVEYLVRFIDAPIFNGRGEPEMAISLTNLPPMTGRRIVELGEQLRATGLAVSQRRSDGATAGAHRLA